MHMVVRAMGLRALVQCDRSLDFKPRRSWPRVFPAMAWNGLLIAGFERVDGQALELADCSWLEAFTACHSDLALAELARLNSALPTQLAVEFRERLFAHYGHRWCDRLQ